MEDLHLRCSPPRRVSVYSKSSKIVVPHSLKTFWYSIFPNLYCGGYDYELPYQLCFNIIKASPNITDLTVPMDGCFEKLLCHELCPEIRVLNFTFSLGIRGNDFVKKLVDFIRTTHAQETSIFLHLPYTRYAEEESYFVEGHPYTSLYNLCYNMNVDVKFFSNDLSADTLFSIATFQMRPDTIPSSSL